MKKQVKPHLVAQENYQYDSKVIFKGTSGNLSFDDGSSSATEQRQVQYIYVTSDEKPKDGEWAMALQTVMSNNNQPYYIRQSYKDVVKFHNGKIKTSGRYDTIDCRKIIAASDPILHADGIPNVSEEFKAEYCRLQGVGKVYCEMLLNKECWDCHNFGDEWSEKHYDRVATDAKGCAILTIEG